MLLLDDRLLTRFAQRARFWRARRFSRRLGLRVSSRRFGAIYAAREASASLATLPYLLRNALLPVFLAVVLLVCLDAFNEDLATVAADWGWGPVEDSTYDVLFEAIAAVTGVFLALYFTAVSNVAASVYVNVPHDIRALIVRDKLGNLYVTGVAFTMAFSILLLIAHALTGRAYTLAPILAGVLACFSIFAFIRLGQRAFYLADPTRLATTLVSDFVGWFKRAQSGSWGSYKPPFQDHYRRRAQQSTGSLAALVAITSDQPHLRGGSVQQLTNSVTGVLFEYLTSKNQIPTKSRWFGTRYEHKQWFLTDSTELDMATSTNTALQPKTLPDTYWVERKLLTELVRLLDSDLESRRYEDAYLTISALEPVWERLGRSWSAKEGVRWIDTLTERALLRFKKQPDPPLEEHAALRAGLWDALAMLPMTLELGFHRDVAMRSIESLRDSIERTDWSNPTAPFDLGLPQKVVAELEQIHLGRVFEKAVGSSVETSTPGWYARERAFYVYERGLREEAEALVELLISWYPNTAKVLSQEGNPDAASAVISRGFEVLWKLEGHVAEWEQIFTNLRQGPLLVDFVRTSQDWDKLKEKIRGMRALLLAQLAAAVPMHAIRKPNSEVPDFLGEAVNRLGEACFQALSEDDAELFKQMFPAYLLGVFSIVDRIRPQVQEWHQSQAVSALAEPIVDAMDLSGYALVFSELHDDPALRDACESIWKDLLSGKAGVSIRLDALAAMHSYQRNLFGITHRAMGRTRWQMAVSERLAELPRDPREDLFREGSVQHRSPLIRRLAPDRDLGGLRAHGSDIFVVRFLQGLDGGADLDFGVRDWIARDLGDDEDPDGEEDPS